ncbi:MAG: glycosyltransferase [Verrucomicrobiota bacterium]
MTSYERWIAQFDTWSASDEIAWRRRLRALCRKPLISVIVPVYNPDLKFLEAAINSVRSQVYDAWELCLADDASTDADVRPFLEEMARSDTRVLTSFRESNGHIAACSNTALALGSGEWCALLDQDDALAPHALAAIACEIAEHPAAGIIYSDEDKIDAEGVRSTPYFKGDWNHELFLGQNFINHLGVYRASLLQEVGGFREGFEGSQDYDLALRCIERLSGEQIRHIPRVLYHWRMGEGSVAGDPTAKPYAQEAARRAIAEHLDRRGLAARVEACPEKAESHRAIYEVAEPRPLVSMVIPTRDRIDLLRRCIDSIRERTDYAPIEFVIVDNGSTESETGDYLRALEKEIGARIVRDAGEFNFSRLINHGAREATGGLLALVNNDIEVENRDWLREMVSHAVRPEIGAVGARLWYPDGTLQHGGVVAGLGGIAGHAMYRIPRGHPGYFNNMFIAHYCSAVTAACLVVRKAVYEQAEGFDEVNLPISFNDIDFCLRLRALGLQNLWTPYANMVHHESASRGHHTAPEEQAQFFGEAVFMQEKWAPELFHDPFYNPNLTLNWPGFDLAFPPRHDAVT